MNDNKTLSILQRIPVVLAVTAASYGLSPSQAQTVNGQASKANAAAHTLADATPAH